MTGRMADSKEDSSENEEEEPISWRSQFAVRKKESRPEQKEVEQTQTKPKPPNYEQARKQGIAKKKQKKKKQLQKIARKEEAKLQKAREEDLEEEEVAIFISPITLKRFVCNAQTRADLDANMYEHSKRVIFSQAMLKTMSIERTFWQNYCWEDGPRNGQVNGVFFNREPTETWEKLQVAENKMKQK